MSASVLLGGRIGDALGVFAESKSSDYKPLLEWDGNTYLGSEYHGLKPGQGSDDSEMQEMAARSLIDNNGFNPDDLSKRYVDWIVSGKAHGYGRTTLAAINNLIAGKHWSESGIEGSWGNGTAMRAAPFGVYFRNDLKTLISSIKVDSAITHASAEAEAGALTIALTVYYSLQDNYPNNSLLEIICQHLPQSKIKRTLSSLESIIDSNLTTKQVLNVLGTGSDVRETVPSVLYMFLKYAEYSKAAQILIRSGGDTDTCSSILCSLYGVYGKNHFSKYHVANVEDGNKLIELDEQLYNGPSKFFPREINAVN